MSQTIFLCIILFFAWALVIFRRPLARFLKNHQNISKCVAIFCALSLLALIIFAMWAIFLQ